MEQAVYGRFLMDLDGLRRLMKEYGMVATGRSTLSVFDGSVDIESATLYFNVSVERLGGRGLWELSKYFSGQGFKYCGEKPEGHEYQRDGLKICVRARGGKPVENVFSNPSTVVMTVLTWYGGYCLFPWLLKERKFAVVGSGGPGRVMHNLYYLRCGFTEVSVGDELAVGKRSFLDGQSQFVRFREGGDEVSDGMLGLNREVECSWLDGLLCVRLVGEGVEAEFGRSVGVVANDCLEKVEYASDKKIVTVTVRAK